MHKTHTIGYDSGMSQNKAESNQVKGPGVVDVLRGAATVVFDRRFDRHFGTNTGVPFVYSLLPPAVRPSQPSPERVIARSLRAVPARPTGRFVDIGAGRGRAMIMALEAGWPAALGIEVRETTCRFARRNLKRYRTLHNPHASWEIRQENAAEYRPEPHDTLLFLFNPFGPDTLATVRDNLLESWRNEPREVWIIYIYPAFGNVLDGAPEMELHRFEKVGGIPFALFRLRGPER